jgi:hypothetical protein
MHFIKQQIKIRNGFINENHLSIEIDQLQKNHIRFGDALVSISKQSFDLKI